MREILLELVREGWADSNTCLNVLTRKFQDGRRTNLSPKLVSDQFKDELERRDLFVAALERGRGGLSWMGPVELEAGPAPHFRELRLEWEGAAAWSIKLDQGVGYWRCRPSGDFPFSRNVQEQVKALNDIAKRHKAVARGGYPTYIYLAQASVSNQL